MDPRKDLTTLGLERLLLTEDNFDVESLIDDVTSCDMKKQILNNQVTLKYAQEQMEISGKLMKENTDCFSLYEFHKGQFLAYRKVIDPHYR